MINEVYLGTFLVVFILAITWLVVKFIDSLINYFSYANRVIPK